MFLETDCTLRTDDSFRRRLQEEHHTGDSLLEKIHQFGMVSQIPYDYMHLVCLGGQKKILHRLVKGRMNEKDLKSASERLLSFQSDIPMEFARKPRDLLDVDRWKATEFRQFLLYTGIVILKEHTSTEKYVHFLSLSCAIRILSCTGFNNLIDYAESLLKYFVKHFPQVYSKEELSYIAHRLLHLCNDVKRFGPILVHLSLRILCIV